MSDQPCPFCEIIAYRAPATIVRAWPDAIAIVPLGPVVDGHLLVIPHDHVSDFSADPDVTAITARRAAELALERGLICANLITSMGAAATQSVFHLHLHLVPRAADDGLALPWYSGRSRTTRKART
jgi:histidine triad (HIT) family protein